MFRILFLILVLTVSAALVHAEKIAPVPAPTTIIPFDTIGKSTEKALIARFEALKNALSKDPTQIVYIINYGTKSQIRKRERQIRKAIALHKIDSKKVVIVSGGDLDYLETKIYLVPEKVEPAVPL